MLIGVKGYGRHKQLRVYKLEGNKYTQLCELDYDSFSAGDLDGDGRLEIASVMRIDKEIPYVKLQVRSLSGNLYKVGLEMALEDGSYPDNVVIGAASEDKQAIFVDLGIGAHSGLTEIIIKENGKYTSTLSCDKGDELHHAFKPYPLLSKDINNDGIIEIGIQSMPPETDNLPMAAIPWINDWYRWNGNDGLIQKPVLQEYSNYGEGFRFIIPDNWSGKFTIENKTDEISDVKSVHFVYLGTDKMKAELLALHIIPKEDWLRQEQLFQNNSRAYLLFGENSKNMLVAELPRDYSKLSEKSLKEYKEMLLDQENIKRRFLAIEIDTQMLYDEKGVLNPEYARKAVKETADRLIYALSVETSKCFTSYFFSCRILLD